MPRPAPHRELVPVPTLPCPDDGTYDDYKAWVLEVHADRVEPGHCAKCGKLPVDWSMCNGEVTVVCHGCGAKSRRGSPYRHPTVGENLFHLMEPYIERIWRETRQHTPLDDIHDLQMSMLQVMGIPANLMCQL